MFDADEVGSSDRLAGGSPAATHFSCLAKKSKQKKATAKSLPFGFPVLQRKKWEMPATRYAQTSGISDPFLALHHWQRQSGIGSSLYLRLNWF
ncbi:hypothetical protein [Oxalicibacterium faecigallinarum]|uniref:hypothetical protein n=1 Tax=Oxalicibacterium faecigallinarum TaxID=573741 RepID=UPI001E4B2109|nr:hypothetical protein [Oxalicibacterium faecigallinarum]